VNASALEADGIIVNFWLPLIPGAIAYIRLRLVNKPPPAHR